MKMHHLQPVQRDWKLSEPEQTDTGHLGFVGTLWHHSVHIQKQCQWEAPSLCFGASLRFTHYLVFLCFSTNNLIQVVKT